MGRGLLRPLLTLAAVALCLPAEAAAREQLGELLGQPVVSIEVERDGLRVNDEDTLALVVTRAGAPLSLEEVRETIWHLYSVGGARDVQVEARRAERGVGLHYRIVPLHEPERLVFTGDLGLSERRLRRTVSERYGSVPSPARAADVVGTVEQLYRDTGYPLAQVQAGERLSRDRPAFVVEVAAGPRAPIRRVEVTGLPLESPARVSAELDLRRGAFYDRERLERQLADYVDELRSRGYYEAVLEHDVLVVDGGRALDVIVDVDPGPRVMLAFEGDPLPEDRRDELVPIRREGSVDEDLIEDSARRVVEFLRAQGYWRAAVEWRRFQTETDLRLTFEVRRGPRFLVGGLEVDGNAAVTAAELRTLVGVAPGDPFVESRLADGLTAATEVYHRLGYADATVSGVVRESENGRGDTRTVDLAVVVVEGPRVVIEAIRLQGAESVPGAELRALLGSAPGGPLNRTQVARDRDVLVLEYLDRGYQTATAEVDVLFRDDRTRAELVFTIDEGPQVLVDHILITGNRRVGTSTIRRELRLAPGEPLGLTALVESQRRLNALGLFRRVQITEIAHGAAHRRDILVTVDEAPPTTIGYGGGIEGGQRLRRGDGVAGAREQLEFAPRGFFEIGRRNLWGKNRSVNLFTRISIRPKDAPADPAEDGRGLGFSEYRVVGTYREPRALGTGVDMLVTGFLEQAIRSSFNFSRQGVHAELARRVAPSTTLTGRYAYDFTRLFDERFNPEDALLIDRLFPKVVLSTVSAAVVRDTRDDMLDPGRGAFLGVDGEMAGRAIGAEVGFAKTFMQGFAYRRLPGTSRTVLAGGVRLGLARGFTREVTVTSGEEGGPASEIVRDLPAAKRFFAGGDTTVRGFALDRLGDASTIDQDGFPRGGNALLVLNAELRLPLWRDLGTVAFVDAGNVFARVGDLSLTGLRSSAGFGLRYASPIGPIRVDLGFKLDPRTLASGERERLTALHVSIGQAF